MADNLEIVLAGTLGLQVDMLQVVKYFGNFDEYAVDVDVLQRLGNLAHIFQVDAERKVPVLEDVYFGGKGPEEHGGQSF